MFKIRTLNSISPIIHEVLSTDTYTVSENEPTPDAYLLRSFDLHGVEIPDSLIAAARAGAGVNNIPLPEMTQKGVAVFNTPGANAEAVAEAVIAGLLLSGRDILGGIAWAQTLKGQENVEKLVEKGKSKFVGPEMRGKRLAVIGLGAVGVLAANAAASGLGMEVVGYDPFISVEHAWALSRSIRRADSLDEAVLGADYVTVHVPLLDSTRGMLCSALFDKLNAGARILNFARADLCNFADMKQALASGKISKYVTDFPTADLLETENVICLPHLGASTPESEERCAEMAARELKDYLEKGIIRNSVNLPEILLGAPEGSRILIIHKNLPGVVSNISTLISGRGINIQNMLNKSRGDIAVTALELSQTPDDSLVNALKMLQNVVRVRTIK